MVFIVPFRYRLVLILFGVPGFFSDQPPFRVVETVMNLSNLGIIPSVIIPFHQTIVVPYWCGDAGAVYAVFRFPPQAVIDRMVSHLFGYGLNTLFIGLKYPVCCCHFLYPTLLPIARCRAEEKDKSQ